MRLKLYTADSVTGREKIPVAVVVPVPKKRPERKIESCILPQPTKSKFVRKPESRYETASHDLTKMISIKIDHKTTILVPAGKNIEQEKRKYLKRIASLPSPYVINKR